MIIVTNFELIVINC